MTGSSDGRQNPVGDVRIDGPVLAVFSALKDRKDRRLAKSAALGGVGAALKALRSGTPEDMAAVARPWEVEGLLEASARLSVRAFDDAVVVDVRPDDDPVTLVARLGDGSRLVMRGVGERETSAWRAALVVDPEVPDRAINPEESYSYPLPDDAADELRWICLTLEEISEALGDRIYTMPGRPMSDETVDLGQGETRRVTRLAWYVGPNGYLEATVARHEIYDGATPAWTHLRGLLWGLADDSACELTATVRANEEPVVSVLVSAPRARLDHALATLAE